MQQKLFESLLHSYSFSTMDYQSDPFDSKCQSQAIEFSSTDYILFDLFCLTVVSRKDDGNLFQTFVFSSKTLLIDKSNF